MDAVRIFTGRDPSYGYIHAPLRVRYAVHTQCDSGLQGRARSLARSPGFVAEQGTVAAGQVLVRDHLALVCSDERFPRSQHTRPPCKTRQIYAGSILQEEECIIHNPSL